MTIVIQNTADIPNKYIRFFKWKTYRIRTKFQHLHHVYVNITKEGSSKPIYNSTVRLGVHGHDILLKIQNSDLKTLWKDALEKTERHLRKHKEMVNNKHRDYSNTWQMQ